MINEWNVKMDFSKYTKFLEKKDDRIIINGKSGIWSFIDKNILDEVKKCIYGEFHISEYLENIKEDDLRNELSEVFDLLVEEKFIVKRGEEDNIKIQHVDFKLTSKCNLKCLHCGSNCDINGQSILSTSHIKLVLNKLFKLKLESIMLTGGEPLIRKDIEEIMSYIRTKFNGKVNLITNGTLIDEQMAIKLKKYIDNISISLDGYDKKSSEFIRGNGTYDKVINAISNLQKSGFQKENITMTMTETLQNKGHSEEFMKLCESLNVKGEIRDYAIEGRGNLNYNKIGVTAYPNLTFKNDDELEGIREELKCMLACSAGSRTLTINECGDIYPCLVLEKKDYKIGNILNEEFEDILQSDSYKKFLDEKIVKKFVDNSRFPKCNKCDVRYFCLHTCIGYNYTNYNNETLLKERCKKIYEPLNKVIWNK